MTYLEFDFTLEPKSPWSDILKVYLSEISFDSFVDTENGLQAYITENEFDLDVFEAVDIVSSREPGVKCQYVKRIIPAQNWNAAWESSFEPVVVNNDLVIIAPFHKDFPKAKYQIIIEPKMSFGTGHHQTTKLMAEALLNVPSFPTSVLDMGCGTGVLAIIAEKLGAKEVVAIDIEEWAYENTIENAARNGCQNIESIRGGVDAIPNKKFDLILANINKNVLNLQLETYSKNISKNGILFLSGFFTTDADELVQKAKSFGFVYQEQTQEDNWCCLKFIF